jgi:hypothetical protein
MSALPCPDSHIGRARASSRKMSDCTSNQAEEENAPNTDYERNTPEPGTDGNDQLPTQIPTPPRSNNAEFDHSDVASGDSQPLSSSRRRYQRGGRKKKKGETLQSVSGFDLPRGQTQEQDEEAEPEWDDENYNGEDYDEEELQKARSSHSASSKKKRSASATFKADTGVKAFNLDRAKSSGGRRPFGITVDRPKSKSKAKKKKKREVSSEEEESEEEDGTEKRKPISIRFDLNLELEIFLKAKIKGDITVTFL